jgi:hypothetical protein
MTPQQPAPIVLDSAGRSFALRTRAADGAGTLAVVLDDALDRLIPALGDAPGAAGVRTALLAIREAIPSGVPSAAEAARMDATVIVADAALGALPADAATAPERDALMLTLDVVRATATTR